MKPRGARTDDYNCLMDVLDRIKHLAAKEFSMDPGSIDPDTPLNTLHIDSLSFIEFLFKVEEQFGVSVSDDGTVDTCSRFRSG